MPSKRVTKDREQPVGVRTKELPNGTKVRIYIFNSGKKPRRAPKQRSNSRGKAKR